MEVISVSIKGISNSGAYHTDQATASNAMAKSSEQTSAAQVQGRTAEVEKIIKNTENLSQKKNKNQEKDIKEAQSQSRQEADIALKKAVEMLNKQLSYTEAQYGFHEETNRVVIKIIDKETDQVLREVPPEKTLKMIAKVWELAGILVDEKM